MRASFRCNEQVRIKRVHTVTTVDFIEHDCFDARMKRKLAVTWCALFCDEAVNSSWMMRTRLLVARLNTALANLTDKVSARLGLFLAPLAEWRIPSPKLFIAYDREALTEILSSALPGGPGDFRTDNECRFIEGNCGRSSHKSLASARPRRIDSASKLSEDGLEMGEGVSLVGSKFFEQFIVGWMHF